MTGQLAAVLTGLTWSIAIICFKKAGDGYHPYALNAFKNFVGLALCGLTLVIEGSLPQLLAVPPTSMLIASVSGILGIGIADSLGLAALRKIGATRYAVVECAYGPTVLLGAMLFLNETLTLQQGAGIIIILAAVGLISFSRKRSEPEKIPFLAGILTGLTGIILMGVGILIVKPLFEHVSLMPLVFLRLLAGTLASYALYRLGANRVTPISEIAAGQHKALMWTGAVMATYVSMIFWLVGFKYEKAGVVAILNQTGTIFTVLLAVLWLREPLRLKIVIATIMAFAGVVLVSLS